MREREGERWQREVGRVREREMERDVIETKRERGKSEKARARESWEIQREGE